MISKSSIFPLNITPQSAKERLRQTTHLGLGLRYGYITIVTSQHIKNRNLFFGNNFEMVLEIVCVDCVDCDDCDLLFIFR